MPGTWHQLAPAVTVEQAIDGTVIDFMANVFLERLPDLRDRRDLPTLGPREKWLLPEHFHKIRVIL
jgi:hypothetical protein